MKTNILWKNSKVIGTIQDKNPSVSQLPYRLVEMYGHNLSLKESPPSSPASEFTDSDGGIYGVRYFDFTKSMSGGFLVSPSSKFVWETASATAFDFNNAGAVRGHIGFHAAWPKSLQDWPNSKVDHHRTNVKALVKGYGDLIQGTMGWRSEKLTILQALCETQAIAEVVARKYGILAMQGCTDNPPAETFKVEWTPEFEAWMNTAFPPPKPRREKIKGEYQ